MRSSLRRGLAVLGTVSLTAGAVLLGGTAAHAADGDGAVLFEDVEGVPTPIGALDVYDGDPLYLYTEETGDDDGWGLDLAGVPANSNGDFGEIASGVPIGFTVTIGGVDYDEFYVSSNGLICLANEDSDPEIIGEEICDWYYDQTAATFGDPLAFPAGTSLAAINLLGTDLNPSNSYLDEGECVDGGYYFADPEACSEVFWGWTDYDGKPALAVTWYVLPPYGTGISATFQALLVDEGDGDALVVLNYDSVDVDGQPLDDYWIDEWGTSDDLAWVQACSEAAEAFEEDEIPAYFGVGVGSVTGDDPAANQFIELFGPECAGGLDPHTDEELVDGGASALNENSLNSEVPGRYILAVVDGAFTLDIPQPAEEPAEEEETLPDTGAEGTAGLIAAALAAGGLLLVAASRRRARV